MKKAIYIFGICSLLFLTGCNNKKETLQCTKTVIDEDIKTMTSVQTIDLNFENDKLVDYTVKTDVTLEEQYLNYIDEMYSNLNQQYSAIKNNPGIEFNSTKEDKKVSSTLTVNLNEINEETKQFLNLTDNKNKESYKTTYEQLGYTCK